MYNIIDTTGEIFLLEKLIISYRVTRNLHLNHVNVM